MKPLFCPGLGATWDVDGNQVAIVNDPSVGGMSPGTPTTRIAEANTCNNTMLFKHTDVFACNTSGSCGSAPAAGALQTTNNGLSNCSGGTNLVTNPCNAGNQFVNCQQDHRCDIATSTCVWNGGAGYFDSTAGGVDLTIGVACNPPSGGELIPICNRGDLAAPGSAPIEIHIKNGLPYADACAPGDAAMCNGTLPAAGLAPGECFNLPCANAGNDYAVLTAPTVVEAPGRCANNQAYTKTQGTPGCAACLTCNTRVSGRVYDPSGATPTPGANNLPLAGITVFQPSGALTPFVDGVTCDSCTSLDSPSVAKAVTDATGAFTLTGVTPGPNARIVVQSGRWRREITTNVTACGANAKPAGTFRMPKNRTDGNGGVADIPKMALVMGRQESLECMFLRMGISQSEIQKRTGPADAARIQLYRSTGMTTTSGLPMLPTPNLWGAGGSLNEYTALILPCDGGTIFLPDQSLNATSAADRARIRDFANAGGRLFMDDWTGETFVVQGAAPFPSTGTFAPFAVPSLPARARVLTPTPPQVLFRDWLTAVGASSDYGVDWLRVDQARLRILDPVASTTQWVRGHTTNSWGAGAPPGPPSNGGNYSLSYSFETPYPGGTCGASGGTGRVIFNGMHVSQTRATGAFPYTTASVYPTNCSLAAALAPEEKALEYQLFQLTACQLGGAPPPPPPLPLPTVTFVRDYEGVCGVGEIPVWTNFYWQSITPAGTSIDFHAATADTPAGFPATPPMPPVAPNSRLIATASGASVLPAPAPPPNWATSAQTVDTHLRTDAPPPNTASKRWLRVYMTFKPTGSLAPTLLGWRQQYSCVPSE
jgi:hypothetical protein